MVTRVLTTLVIGQVNNNSKKKMGQTFLTFQLILITHEAYETHLMDITYMSVYVYDCVHI